MTFDEWYKKHWEFVISIDKHRAQLAWLAAKDFNATHLQDLEYICELAQNYLKGTGGIWPERIARYRETLRKLSGEIPG